MKQSAARVRLMVLSLYMIEPCGECAWDVFGYSCLQWVGKENRQFLR